MCTSGQPQTVVADLYSYPRIAPRHRPSATELLDALLKLLHTLFKFTFSIAPHSENDPWWQYSQEAVRVSNGNEKRPAIFQPTSNAKLLRRSQF